MSCEAKGGDSFYFISMALNSIVRVVSCADKIINLRSFFFDIRSENDFAINFLRSEEPKRAAS